MSRIPDGLVAVVKGDCPTCALIAPVLGRLATEHSAAIATEDDENGLELSFRAGVEIVPTLLRVSEGREVARVYGWNRDEWRTFTGIGDLGSELPANRPGCGSRTQEPGMAAKLAVRYGAATFGSRVLELPPGADEAEWCFEQGWSDGLPVVPPSEERVYAMLQGTRRRADEVLGAIPPNFAECTVEKAAINAVMAGCRPEYLPVVLAAIEAALLPAFGLHGILATTNAVGPVIMVNGPLAGRIGMNAKGNALGQGNRANASIGRALQLVVRNVGGGRPGEIDRAVFGNPGKYTFCFAEDESDARWESFAVERGFPPQASTVTLFPGDGVIPVIDHLSRRPEDLLKSYAGCLRALYNPGQVNDVGAFLVVAGEHANVFYEAGWSKARLKAALAERLWIPMDEVVEGRSGKLQMSAEELLLPRAPKFRTGSLNIVRAGGAAGKYSAIISGLGSKGINPVTQEIRE
ncbi:MAG TPA: thioredoxin family protein [Burkholderiales bacterium]|nr:thioredoxin family protein [Burkholderiales bacterium]